MGSSWKRQCVEEPSYHDDRSMGEHAFLAFTQSERNSVSKLDKFCQSTSIPDYDRGERRKGNPQYIRLNNEMKRQLKLGNLERARALRKEKQHIPSVVTADPEYRRLQYVRYAADFL